MGVREAGWAVGLFAALAGPAAAPAAAQTAGQSTTQPSPSQNQSQVQTNQVQQPPNARTNKPSAAAAQKPDPHPALSR